MTGSTPLQISRSQAAEPRHAAWPRLRRGYEFRWRRALELLGAPDPGRSLVRLWGNLDRSAFERADLLAALHATDRRLARAVRAVMRSGHGRPSCALRSRVQGQPVEFVCAGCLGGLARWLRAAGFEAEAREGAPAAELLRDCVLAGKALVTSDSSVLCRGSVRDGTVLTFWIPPTLEPVRQLEVVLGDLGLCPRTPRCMACGGSLRFVPRTNILDALPPRTAKWREDYWRCEGCGKLFWKGTHWARIRQRLDEVRQALGCPIDRLRQSTGEAGRGDE